MNISNIAKNDIRLLPKLILIKLALVIVTGVVPQYLWAQRAHIPYHKEPYHLSSGLLGGFSELSQVKFGETVRAPNAPWLRLHFSDYKLGVRSYITWSKTSLFDEGFNIIKRGE